MSSFLETLSQEIDALEPIQDEREFEEQLKRVQAEHERRRARLSLLRSPLHTLSVLRVAASGWLLTGLRLARSHARVCAGVLVLAALVLVASLVPGPQRDPLSSGLTLAGRGGWWLLLGVASSIGLGTGLHTFVLYLAPHCARVALTAYECNSTRFAVYGPEAFVCPPGPTPADPPSFLSVFGLVQLEALLWGAGTALGELPPYFLARAARLSGSANSAELDAELRPPPPGTAWPRATLMRVRAALVRFMLGPLGFWGIALFASIPNPLFDLAGLVCGHFLVSFDRFFAATLLGKAVVKAHMQTALVVFLFAAHHVESLVALVERYVPLLHGRLAAALEAERARHHRHAAAGGSAAAPAGESVLARAWNGVLALMLGYFAVALLSALAQQHAATHSESRIAQLRRKRSSRA